MQEEEGYKTESVNAYNFFKSRSLWIFIQKTQCVDIETLMRYPRWKGPSSHSDAGTLQHIIQLGRIKDWIRRLRTLSSISNSSPDVSMSDNIAT